jgi:hypothetical protein
MVLALVAGDGSGTEVDGSGTTEEGTIGGVEDVDKGSDIEPEIADTKLTGNRALCLVDLRL